MAKKPKTNAEIVSRCNALAHKFHTAAGWKAAPDTKYYEAHIARVRQWWDLAVMAYDHIEATDVEDALTQLEDDQSLAASPPDAHSREGR